MAGSLPRVLAGPIVRRVEPRTVSFWIALSQAATVTALIFKGKQNAGATPQADGQGTLATRAVGASLHVAVVTIDLSGAQQPLAAGELYSYDVRFEFAGGEKSDLKGEKLLAVETTGTRIPGVDAAAPLHQPLGFVVDQLPSFLAPPAKFTDLRVVHSSCRRPGAGSFDALPALAELVKDPAKRPHQLFLTGDQIYGDDMATPFLPVVIALGDALLGAQKLPGFPPDPRTGGDPNGPVTGAGLAGNAANLPPMRRKWLLWVLAKFTGEDVQNHAITFPEYVAQHLLAWSPRAWRAIPPFASVFQVGAPGAAIAPWLNRPWFCAKDPNILEATLKTNWSTATINVKEFKDFNASSHHIARYAAGTPAVAQVLANTPTYMQFDDHEIADDWNLNGRWAAKVYNAEWGRYVVRNGLMAYAFMQAWGSNPAEFATDKPGKALLDAIPAVVAPTATPTLASMATIDILLGFDKPTTAVKKRVSFNYAVEAGDYRAVVLDTRTHRTINDLSLETPNLIENLDEQLPERPATATQQILVVVSPVPVFGPVVMEQLGQPLAQQVRDAIDRHRIGEVPGFVAGDAADKARNAGCGDRGLRGAEKYDREGWSANDGALEALLARLASWRSVVLLSGDVHYACTTTLDYWKQGTAEPARIVQCISSPAKNIFKAIVDQVVRKVANLQRAEEVPAERLAWKKIGAGDLVPAGARLSLARRAALRREPALLPTHPWPAGSKIPPAKPPDWRWRLLPLVDTTTRRTDLPASLRLQPLPAGVDAIPPPQRLARISEVHQLRLTANLPPLRRIVFQPNFGTLAFRGTGAAVEVVHTLYSPVTATLADVVTPLPAGPIAEPNAAFGPHTIHIAAVRTPAAAIPPTLQADPP